MNSMTKVIGLLGDGPSFKCLLTHVIAFLGLGSSTHYTYTNGGGRLVEEVMDDQQRENRFRALLVYPVLFYTMLLLGVGAGAGAGAGCTGGGGGGGGGGNRTGTETVELRAATVAVEEAFLSADPSNVLQLLTGEAKALHEGTISSIQSEMVSFGEDFKSRNLKSISSNYAEYEFTAAGETFTVAFSLQEDGTWKLMRF